MLNKRASRLERLAVFATMIASGCASGASNDGGSASAGPTAGESGSESGRETETASDSETGDESTGGDPGTPPEAGELLGTLTVPNGSSTARVGEYAFSSVPLSFDATLLADTRAAVFTVDGTYVPSQTRALSRYNGAPDDATLPVQWLQVGLIADVGAQSSATYELRATDGSENPPGISVTSSGGTHTIDTGAATFRIDPNVPGLITELQLAGGSLLLDGQTPGGPRMVTDSGAVLDASVVVVDPDAFAFVEEGPARVSVLHKGHFVSGAATQCGTAGGYERFGYTVILSFTYQQPHVDIEFNFRNECGSGFDGVWTDEAVTINEVAWDVPLAISATEHLYAGEGAVTSSPAGEVLEVEQATGGGSPWARRARVRSAGNELASGETFASPAAGVTGDGVQALVQMPWMRYREPQGLRADGSTMSWLFVSEPVLIAEASAVWGQGRLSIRNDADEADVETLRERTRVALERGLLVHPGRDAINDSGVFPSLGTDAPSAIKTAYLDVLTTLHDDTVRSGGQWDTAKTYGAQLWPDTQFDQYNVTNPEPAANSGHMNYWNPANAVLMEWLRSGDPNWAWSMGLPASWLQMYTAYYNIGDYAHSNRNGVSPTSGGTGIGQWHRSAQGSDDYAYNRNQYIAYVVRPTAMLRERFRSAGVTLSANYSVPWAEQETRDIWTQAVIMARRMIQQFEMLHNCASFVAGPDGEVCRTRLNDLVEEILADNLSAGVMCVDDVPSTACGTPQQFMQNAMHYGFFMRYQRSFPGIHPELRAALSRVSNTYLTYGMNMNGGSIDVDSFAAGLSCTLNADRSAVVSCDPSPDSEGNLVVYAPTRGHTMALVMQGHELDPSVGTCAVFREALDEPALYEPWWDWVGGSGFFKGANQMLQDAVFAVGIYDTCTD